MNRFFSKLDLRDIKISPEGSRFPPDADELEAEAETEVASTDNSEPEIAAPDTPVVADELVVEPETVEYRYESAPSPPESTWDDVVPVDGAEAPGDAVETYSNGHVAALNEFDAELTSAPAATATMVVPAIASAVELAGATGEVLKVSARSRPSAVAGAIAGVVRESGRAEVQAIGAGATNQAVKAVAIARDYLRETGIDAVCLPAFIDVTIENEDRTAIRLVVEAR